MKALTILPILFFTMVCTSTRDAGGNELAPISNAVQPQDALKPGQSAVLTFASAPDNGRQVQALWFDKAGSYTLTFSSANPPYSNHWMIWDCIQLKDGKAMVWGIGDCETPPDYSKVAFDEFCDPAKVQCPTSFSIEASSNQQFPKEINDNSITEIEVSFEISSKYARKNLSLDLSTLFSTHDDIKNYKLRVALD